MEKWRGEGARKEEYGDKGLIGKQRIVWGGRNGPTPTYCTHMTATYVNTYTR